MTAHDILWHDWDWIADTLERIKRDKGYERFHLLEIQMAVAAAKAGHAEHYTRLRESFLTEDDLERIEEERVKDARKKRSAKRRSIIVPNRDNDTSDGAG